MSETKKDRWVCERWGCDRVTDKMTWRSPNWRALCVKCIEDDHLRKKIGSSRYGG